MNVDKSVAERIASEYTPKETSQVVALKKLDRKAKFGARFFGYTFGSIMALVLGVGMCFSLKVLGDGSTLFNILGYVLGGVGIIGCASNYFIYKKLLTKGKAKYASDIIALAKTIA
ncbi:MAG: dihydropteridine reductase [Bacilli bacterium]|nr:dihydropteridine reductase [Bacilli bacterium]